MRKRMQTKTKATAVISATMMAISIMLQDIIGVGLRHSGDGLLTGMLIAMPSFRS